MTGELTALKMEMKFVDIGKMMSEKAIVKIIGWIREILLEFSKKIKNYEEFLHLMMVQYIKEILVTINFRDMECVYLQMGIDMKENGKIKNFMGEDF